MSFVFNSMTEFYYPYANDWVLRNLGFNKCHSNWLVGENIGDNGMSEDEFIEMMRRDHAFHGAKFVLKRNYFDDALPEYVQVPIKGRALADLWAAADVAIGLADPDHTEIIGFKWSEQEGGLTVLVD